MEHCNNYCCHFTLELFCNIIPLFPFCACPGSKGWLVARLLWSFLACGRVSESCSSSGRHRSPCLRLASAMSPPPSAPRQPSKSSRTHSLSLSSSLFFLAPNCLLSRVFDSEQGSSAQGFVEGVILIVLLMQVTQGGVWEFEVEILLHLLTFSLSCWQLNL